MATVTYNCTGCVVIDRAVIDAYNILTSTEEYVSSAESDRATAEEARVLAEQGRVQQASDDHGVAQEDHRIAVADHGTAGDDHTTATGDHRTASDDHTTAVADHGTASDDHVASTSATDRANDAAAAAEHMVDIHQGPPGPEGKPAVLGNNGNWWTWDEDTEQYVDTGQRAQGPTGATPNFAIGTVSTGAAGSQAAATITGTTDNPLLNLTIPQGLKGDQGNTGSSVDYPYELVNNETTDDATKGATAASAKRLKDELSQLEAEMDGLPTQATIPTGTWTTIYNNLDIQQGEVFYLKVSSNVAYTRMIVCGNAVSQSNYLTDDNDNSGKNFFRFVARNAITYIQCNFTVSSTATVDFVLYRHIGARSLNNAEKIDATNVFVDSMAQKQENLVDSFARIDFSSGMKITDSPYYTIKSCALIAGNYNLSSNASYYTTNLIKVEGSTNYISNKHIRVIEFLDDSFVFCGGFFSQTSANTPFTTTARARYMRASIHIDYWSEELIINKGNSVISTFQKPYKLNPGVDVGWDNTAMGTTIAENTSAIVSLNSHRVTDENNIGTLQQKVSDLESAVQSAVFEVGGVTYDSVPTQGSTKAVTSGGVYTALQNLKGTDKLAPKLNTNPVENIIRTHSFVSLFHDWGVVGASFDSGEMNYDNNTNAVDMYDFSWLQVMCRMNGVTGYNFSKGGWTAKTWCNNTTERGWGNGVVGASANPKKAYIVSYGENDQKVFSDAATPTYTDGNGMAGDLSTDINTSGDFAPTTGHDTFAGWMACIIQRIKSVQPKAVIFVKTMWHNRTDVKGVNTVIRDLPNYFTNVYIIDIWEYYPANMFNSEYFTGGHPNALGYEFYAAIFNTYIDWIVRSNYALFNQVQFIGTNYSY